MHKRNNRTLEATKVIFARLPAEDHNYIRQLAHRNNEPMSAVIRRAIREMKGRKV